MLEESQHESFVDYVRYLNTLDLNDKEKRRRISFFLEGKARERGIPIHGCFELTPLCNLDCKMCYIHLSGKDFDANRLLSSEKWIDIVDQARNAGMRKATLTGGECLTYGDFDSVYLYLIKHNISVTVMTNGVFLDEKRIDFFKKYKPANIQLSLYGSDEKSYEKVTGHRVFEKVFTNICAIKDAGLRLQIAITPNKYMYEDMHRLIDFVHSLNLPYEVNCKLTTPRKNTGRNLEDMTLDQYVEIYRLRAEKVNMELIPNTPEELPMTNRERRNDKGLLCGAGMSSFAVSYDGYMMLCNSLDEYKLPISELGFNRAWEKLHALAINYPIPGECSRCSYFHVCIHCQGLHKDAPKGHCNQEICERTRKLAEAGFFRYKGKKENE
ncbi:MAG: radical SAM protein [Clostridia bacterium]|nr:radical SAM protein [Clostridia bacterium]